MASSGLPEEERRASAAGGGMWASGDATAEVGTLDGQMGRKRRRTAMEECCREGEDEEAWRRMVSNERCRPYRSEQTVEDSKQLGRQEEEVGKGIRRLGAGKQRTWDQRLARRGTDVGACPSCDGSGTRL